MNVGAKREILADSPLFDNLLPAELGMLADLFSVRDYRAGEVVFHEGDVGDCLYVVAEGEVEVLQKGASGALTPIVTLRPPHFFGEMSLIDKEYRSATVRARTEAKLLQLANENLHSFAKNYRNGFTWVVVNIAKVLSSRLRETNKRLAAKL
ncbi:MAG: cyclic nucleotide-binding domain-containing protein [Myxococcota bacterium]